jgi:Cobalamin-independent synthase, Catalytic domain
VTPWPAGSATGIGSLPGTDIDEALRVVFGELPDLLHLPELPARGAGADMIGRGATFLAELPVEIQPSGWRLTSRPGHDLRRARDFLERDLDALEAAAEGYAGTLKVQVVGPWTLAASLELHSGHHVVSDHGATRELAQSLAEGLRGHLADVARRVPAATIVTQLDEPAIPAVLGGRVPTPSGYGTVRAVEASVVEQTLRDVLAVVPARWRVVHCCAADAPITLLRGAGADAISLDKSQPLSSDALGEAVEAGTSLWLGVVPGTDAQISLNTAREPVHKLWRELGFADEQLATSVVPTPACGLAGASPGYVRRALSVVRDVGRSFRDLQA